MMANNIYVKHANNLHEDITKYYMAKITMRSYY